MNNLKRICNHNKSIVIGIKKYNGKRITPLGTCCRNCINLGLKEVTSAAFMSEYWGIAKDSRTGEIIRDVWAERM